MSIDDAAVAPAALRVADVDGIPLSARVREVPDPRAVLLALHGNNVSSRYFDHPTRPTHSLLHVAAALGFTTVAVDRPGYGMSRAFAFDLAEPQARVDLVYGALDQLLAGRPRGAGVFVVAHSAGCELALRLATDPRGADLLGVELAGTGLRYTPAVQELRGAGPADAPRGERPEGVLDLLWQPYHLYPDDVVDGEAVGARGPAYEADVSRDWVGQTLPELAARVGVPVHLTLGDQESIFVPGPDSLAELAALFTASPRVVAEEQAGTGHNLSLGHTAQAYHQRVLGFVEECLS